MASVYDRGDGTRKREAGAPFPVRPIMFVDGHCLLCQRAAQWVVDHDRRGRVALAALQGETARRLLPAALCGSGDGSGAPPGSLVWRTGDGRVALRSEAVLAVAAAIGGWYGVAARVLRLVPRPLRDAGYRLVARHRHRWFGGAARCRLPGSGRRRPQRVIFRTTGRRGEEL